MVTMSNSKWQMCMDYTNFNKAYPKDTYPFLNIDPVMIGDEI